VGVAVSGNIDGKQQKRNPIDCFSLHSENVLKVSEIGSRSDIQRNTPLKSSGKR